MILDSWRWVIQAPKTWAGLQTFNWWPTPKMTDPTAGWPHKLQTRPQWLVASSSLAKGAKHGWSRSWIRDFSAQSAATWGVLRYVSFTFFFFLITPGCEGAIQFHAYFFRSWKSPPNLWVFLFLAFFLVVIRSRSFLEGAIEMVQIVLVTQSQRTRQTPLHVVLLELRSNSITLHSFLKDSWIIQRGRVFHQMLLPTHSSIRTRPARKTFRTPPLNASTVLLAKVRAWKWESMISAAQVHFTSF